MKCVKEEEFTAEVSNTKLIEHRFNDSAYEVMVEFVCEKNAETGTCQEGKIYLDLSPDYVQAGTHQGERQCDLTRDTLKKVGVDISGGELAQVQNLNGKKISVFGKKNKKGYSVFYLNTSTPTVEADTNQASVDIKALFGDGASAKAPATNANPFAPKAETEEKDEIPF